MATGAMTKSVSSTHSAKNMPRMPRSIFFITEPNIKSEKSSSSSMSYVVVLVLHGDVRVVTVTLRLYVFVTLSVPVVSE